MKGETTEILLAVPGALRQTNHPHFHYFVPVTTDPIKSSHKNICAEIFFTYSSKFIHVGVADRKKNIYRITVCVFFNIATKSIVHTNLCYLSLSFCFHIPVQGWCI